MCFRSVGVKVSIHILTNLPKQSNFLLLPFLVFVSFLALHTFCVYCLFLGMYSKRVYYLLVQARDVSAAELVVFCRPAGCLSGKSVQLSAVL